MSSFFRRILAVAVMLSLTGAGCTKGLDTATQTASARVTIEMWGVVDDTDAYDAVFKEYHAAHPNITIDFRRFRLEEYEQQLLNALAEDRGPDLFLIHNDWLGKYMSKIVPMPATTQIAYSVMQGTINPQQTWVLQTDNTISLKDYKDQFADVCAQDTVRLVNFSKTDKPDYRQSIMGIPVSVDTLGLYYNKDLLNDGGIATPPENWDDFKTDVMKLTKVGTDGTILQSGVGLGTGNNVSRAQDILTALMMQNGAQMADENGTPTFQSVPEELKATRSVPPSYQALEFYTDFANPAKEDYAWNAGMPNSLDAFISGQTAFYFGYAYDLPTIRARAPKLNLGITKLPQISGNPVRNVANYWFWTVAKKSKNQDVAWNFINFMTKPDQMKSVLDIAKKPAARKSLLGAQLNDEDVGVFASQVLTAKSWYRGNDPATVSSAFTEMISNQLNGTMKTNEAVDFAVGKIIQTY